MERNVVQNKIELLSKSAWTYKDIIEYFPRIKSAPTAIAVKNRAIKEFDGRVKYGDEYATVESVLNLFGTNRDYEIKAIKNLVFGGDIVIAREVIDFGEDNDEEQ